MNNQHYKFIGYLFATFTLVSTLFQTLALQDQKLRYGAFGATIFCAIFSYLFFKRSRHYTNAIRALDGLMKKSDKYIVRPVLSESELKEVWRVDIKNFEDHAIPVEQGISWWKKYPQGVYVLLKGHTIQGYISYWPLSVKAFNDFCSGKRLEHEITSKCIVKPDNNNKQCGWYIGSIALMAKFRHSKAIRYLILESFTQWINSLSTDTEISLCALAYSDEGEVLLQKFGFHKFADAKESPHRLPVYLLKIKPELLKFEVHKMFKLSDMEENTQHLDRPELSSVHP